MSIIKEFQDFIARGNALDLAVGIIMGAAFNKIVNSIVNDLVMPPVGWLIGGVDFKDLRYIIKAAADGAAADANGLPTGEVSIKYGAFINVIIEFFIVALSVFFVVKVMNALMAYREKLLPGGEDAATGDEPAKS